MSTTLSDVQSAAELERQRLANQAAQARAAARAQAQHAEAETETQARQAITETERQAETVKTQAEEEAQSRHGQIRKQRGAGEKEAQAAMARARQARNIEQRKVVLPVTKPRDLGTASYISTVERARRRAQQSGEDAKVAVTRVRDDYFKQVDEAKAKAIADINKQKVGIVTDIQAQLVTFNADITKQLANLNSGVDSWEADSNAAINKAQADYEAAVKAALDRNGTDVFADMKGKGLIPTTAIYDSYDKTTGQLNYTTPDTRSGEEIFADLQSQNKLPPNAIYKSYDSTTGEVSYSVEAPNFGSSIFSRMQIKGAIPKDATFISYNATNKTVTYFVAGAGISTIADTTGTSPTLDKSVTTSTSSSTVEPPQHSTNVVATVGSAALAGGAVITMGEVGGGIAAIPTPPTWAIGGAIIVAALVVGLIERQKITSIINGILHRSNQQASSSQTADAVVTNKDGTATYSLQQFTLSPQSKKSNIETFPHEQPMATDLKNIPPDIKPLDLKFYHTQEQFEVPPFPTSKEPPLVMIRDPFDVPELRQKASNVLAAISGLQAAADNVPRTIIKTMPMTRQQYELLNEALRQGRITEGKRIIESLAKKADTPGIARSYRLAYEDYLRKKAALDAARKAYVASLNPQPMKGKGSTDAKAAAIGVWLAQDIMQGEIVKALNRGESMRSAVAQAQTKIQEVSKQLSLSQHQVNAATATVIYQAALSSMAQTAVQTASLTQTKGLTATQIKTQTLTATQQAVHTIVQQAVDTKTITQAQATTMEAELDQVAEAIAEMTLKLKLPKPSEGNTGEPRDRYPDGTVAWNMGNLRGKGDEYKIIPPPYTMQKPITSFKPPNGMRKTKGTPQETLTFIGGKVPFENVSFDLGVTDGFIDVKTRQIKFTGRGEQTNVGTRIESMTQGVALEHNPPLLQQLVKRGNGHRRTLQTRTKVGPLPRVASISRKTRTVSHGVYSDRGGTRISRRPRKHWKRIY